MKSRENIVSYTPEEVLELNRRGATGSDWERVNSMSQAEIERLAAEDMKEHGFSAATHDQGYFTTEPIVGWRPRLHSIKADINDDLVIAEITSRSISIRRAVPVMTHAVYAVLGSLGQAYELSFETITPST